MRSSQPNVHRLGVLLLVMGLSLIGSPRSGQCQGSTKQGPPRLVSIINLIAHPETYNGQQIAVQGYATVGFENNFLYQNPYDAQTFAISNALPLEITKDEMTQWRKFDHQPVRVEGTFFVPDPKKGSWFPPNGSITKITLLEWLYRAGWAQQN